MPLNSDLLAQMMRYHVATERDPVPGRTGITYVWAGNGIFKYGRNVDTEVIVLWSPCFTPGLPQLNAAIAWNAWSGRLPGALLVQALEEAKAAVAPRVVPGPDATAEILVPVEVQWLVVQDDDGQPVLLRPTQDASPGRVRYEMPDRRALLDIHSHHAMQPFFSTTDDSDDTWLSASVVIGDIFTQPSILCRLNVYGTRQIVPATLLFDDLGPFVDKLSTRELDIDRPERPKLTPWDSVLEMIGWLVETLTDASVNPLANDEDAKHLMTALDTALKAEQEGRDAKPTN